MITLNGRECDVAAGDTVAAVLARLELAPDARGVAVAVDGEVVPRAEWPTYEIRDGQVIELITAVQGG